MRVARLASALAAAAIASLGGAQAEQAATFEVASVKPNHSGSPTGGIAIQPGGRFTWTNVTLSDLIGTAYQRKGFDRFEITGGPSWVKRDRFDVTAKAATSPTVDPDGVPRQFFAMLLALLEERFKVAAHYETKEGPVYALVLARRDGRPGPQLRKVDIDCASIMREMTQGKKLPVSADGRLPCAVGGSPGRLRAGALTMAQLANVLSASVDRIVLDKTGLTGSFDIDLDFAPDLQGPQADRPADPEPPTDPGPSVFTALQEQLGLKLEATRGPVDVLVIDRAEPPVAD